VARDSIGFSVESEVKDKVRIITISYDEASLVYEVKSRQLSS
jgi:hypothetical protein